MSVLKFENFVWSLIYDDDDDDEVENVNTIQEGDRAIAVAYL